MARKINFDKCHYTKLEKGVGSTYRETLNTFGAENNSYMENNIDTRKEWK